MTDYDLKEQLGLASNALFEVAAKMQDVAGNLRRASMASPATSPASSAQYRGPATKPSASSTGTPVVLTENQAAILTPLVEAITACIKSTSSTLPEWALTWDGSSILLRISPSPIASGSNEAGIHGPAGREPRRYVDLWPKASVPFASSGLTKEGTR